MNVVSVCSGAGGMDLGFERAGCRTVALCEVVPWLRDLLALRFPNVPCWPDLATLDPAELPDGDILIGGTPCQDLSVTGLRAGLDGAKSGLFWDFMRVRNARGYKWTVWENVEGALSSNDGLDFACVLGAFVGADVAVPTAGWPGAGVVAGPWGSACWRVLDAQHFGVPQRRRRVFVVGHLGGPCSPEVLLEPSSGERDSQAGREAGEGDPATFGVRVAGTLGALTGGTRTTDLDGHGAYVSAAVCAKWSKGTGGPAGDECQNLVAATLTSGSARGPGVNPPGRRREDDVNLVVLGEPAGGAARDALRPVAELERREAGPGVPGREDRVARAPDDANGVRTADGLAGWVDGARSAVDHRPDNRRVSACGNGVAEPVARWIAGRIISHEEALRNAA